MSYGPGAILGRQGRQRREEYNRERIVALWGQTVGMDQLRDAIASLVQSLVAGPSGGRLSIELSKAEGQRWFGPDRPILQVHRDAAMFVGGVRAILLQSLHPLAMAGVAAHSDYRNDPWGRLQRTAGFLAATTFGTVEQADQAIAVVRRVHERVSGTAPDGRPYSANDPHLLAWVHLAEVESFLVTTQRFGARRLADPDGYVADMAVIGARLGVEHPPRSVAELRTQLRGYQVELRGTKEAREAARFLLVPPLPIHARPAYTALVAGAVATLPWWARLSLHLPLTPATDAVLLKPATDAVTRVLRWALPPAADAA